VVVAATRFFASQSGAGHQQGEAVKVGEFVIVAAGMFGMRKLHIFEECHSGGEFVAVANDADVAPHEVADLR